MVFHWSLFDSRSPQVTRTLLSILAVLNNVVVWMVSTRLLIFKFFSLCNNPLVTVPKVPITIGIIVTFMSHNFFQFPNKVEAAVVSILLYGCTTWTLTKQLEKKLDGNYTIMLRTILYKSWRRHSTRHQLYDHLPPITKTIQVRRTRHAGHFWRSRD